MLKLIKYSSNNSSKSLQNILNKRKSIQKKQSLAVSRIIQKIKKNGDKAIINYEKKFSKVKTRSRKILYTNKEITKISKKNRSKRKKSN